LIEAGFFPLLSDLRWIVDSARKLHPWWLQPRRVRVCFGVSLQAWVLFGRIPAWLSGTRWDRIPGQSSVPCLLWSLELSEVVVPAATWTEACFFGLLRDLSWIVVRARMLHPWWPQPRRVTVCFDVGLQTWVADGRSPGWLGGTRWDRTAG